MPSDVARSYIIRKWTFNIVRGEGHRRVTGAGGAGGGGGMSRRRGRAGRDGSGDAKEPERSSASHPTRFSAGSQVGAAWLDHWTR